MDIHHYMCYCEWWWIATYQYWTCHIFLEGPHILEKWNASPLERGLSMAHINDSHAQEMNFSTKYVAN
jgi:hypothetical protein